jgi:hypothetical protein
MFNLISFITSYPFWLQSTLQVSSLVDASKALRLEVGSKAKDAFAKLKVTNT